MIGKPKYKLEDSVKFQFGEDVLTGTIAVIDKYGVFENDSDVHYDIFIDNYKGKPWLFKHIIETDVQNDSKI